MASIPILNQQIGPGLGSVSSLPQNRTGGMGGRTLATEADRAEEWLTKVAEQDAAMEGAALLSKFRVDAETAREKLQSSVQTPDDFTKIALKEFDTMSGDFLKNVPNKRAASFVEQRLTDVRAQYALNSLQWETGARNQRRALMVEDTLNSMGARVLKNPNDYDTALQEWDDAITASGVPIDVADKMRRNGKDQLAVSLAQGMIRRNPFQALQSLQTDARFTTLDPDKLESLIRSSESAIQHKAAMADHAAAQSERNRRLMGDQVSKEGWDLLSKGQMTEEWMDQNRSTLDSSDYKMLRQGMTQGGSITSRAVQLKLLQDVYTNGVDASGDILAAARRGDLDMADARSLLNENQAATPAKKAKSFITQYLKPSDINPSAVQAQSYAEAIAEFDRLYAEDPKQDPLDLARKVVQRNALADMQNITAVAPLPSPQYTVGNRNELDIKATKKKIWDAFKKKYNGDQAAMKQDKDFLREMRNLKAFEDAYTRNAAAQAATRQSK
jgi:hypothetical protein